MSAAEESLAAEAHVSERVLTPRFAVVVASMLAYMVGVGALSPVLPRYVRDELGGGGAAVGLVVGSFAVSALLFRPWTGRLGDTRGRRLLVVVGCAFAGVATICSGLIESMPWLIATRLVTGAGEAAVFVGAATAAQDLAPPGRRGQAASVFSVAIYGGLAFGPVLGEAAFRRSPETAFALAGAAMLLGGLLGLGVPARPAHQLAGGDGAPAGPPPTGWRKVLHPVAIKPGLVLVCSATGFAGFSAFVPLYVDRLRIGDAGPVFLVYGVLVLVVRIGFSRLPDVLGTRRGPLLALALQATGLLAMGVFSSKLGLYASTAVFSAGASLLYPALFPLVVDRAPDAERSQAIATFTLFFDLAQGMGAPLLGLVVALADERAAFAAAGGLALVGLAGHARATRGRRPAVGASGG